MQEAVLRMLKEMLCRILCMQTPDRTHPAVTSGYICGHSEMAMSMKIFLF